MRRYVVLGALYFAQGLPFGFFSHAVPTFLNRTHPPEIVGLSALLAIPWGLKFLWAPFVDRAPGRGPERRTRLIVPLQIATSVALLALSMMHATPTDLLPLLVGFFLVSVLAATQDVATDALALDLLSPEERGHGGAIQAGAYRAGMIAGGGGVLALVERIGIGEAFRLMAVAVALSTAPILLLRGAPATPAEVAPTFTPRRGPTGLLASFLRRPDVAAIFGFLVLYKLGDALAAGMVTRWFVKQGLSTTDIALSRGVGGGVAAVVGSFAGGALLTALGRRRGLTTCALLQSVAIAMYLVLAALAPRATSAPYYPVWAYHAASVFEHLAGGAATAALFARMMDLCREDARATDYTAMSCALVAVQGLGLVASGFVTKGLGLFGLFAVATAAGVLAPVAAYRHFARLQA